MDYANSLLASLPRIINPKKSKFMETLIKPIHYEPAQLHQIFLAMLDDFSNWTHTDTLQKVLGKALLRQLHTQKAQIRERLAANFSLVVVGEFKRGKSTLLNALLKTPIATTNVTPETVTINQIQYGSDLRIDACFADGGEIQLEPDDLKADHLLPLLERLPQKVDHLNIKAPVEWLQGICLVDTPGTGDIFNRFDLQIYNYLTKADAIIFVISAFSPLSKSEQTFLKLSVLPQDFPKVFFVVNMMDMARTDEDAKKLMQSIQGKIIRLFPNARLFGISALDEFCRLQSLPRPNPDRTATLEVEFNALRDCLQESIFLNRDVIQLSRASDQMQRLLRELESNIRLLQNAMQADREGLKNTISQCEDQSSELFAKLKEHQEVMRYEIETLSHQACEWMEEFMQRLEKEAIASIPDYSLTDLRQHYYFFLADSIRQAVSLCLDNHRSAILTIAENSSTIMAEDLRQLTDFGMAISGIAPVTLIDSPWTNLDTLHLFMDNSPFKLIADLLVKQAKESNQVSQTYLYQQSLTKVLPELRHSLARKIQTLYNNIGEKFQQQVENAYQRDIEAALCTMRQAQELSAEEEREVNTTNTDLEEALSMLADNQLMLKSFKQKLWSDIA